MQKLKILPSQRQVQKQVLSQRQLQAIKLLQLNRLELETLIREELEQNPLLETADMVEESENVNFSQEEVPEESPRTLEEKIFEEVFEKGALDIDWSEKFDTEIYIKNLRGYNEEADSFESYTPRQESLYENLAKQLKLVASDDQEYQVGEFLIGSIDKNGYLKEEDIKAACREFGVDEEFVHGVREKIMSLDPPGIGALTVKEALIAQIESREDISRENKELLIKMLNDYSEYLARNKIPMISEKMGISIEKVYELINILKTLTLFPAALYGMDDNFYVIPDVFVRKVGEEYVVELNNKGLPQLTVNDYYRSLLENKDTLEKKQYKFLKEKYNNALWLKRCVEERNNTILRVAKAIVEKQRDFLEKGKKYLKPLRQRDIAEELGLSEATISRVSNGKYMDTPRGVFEFKYFFSTSIPTTNNSFYDTEDKSAKAIQERIKEIIEKEDKRKPLSDAKIVKILAEEGIKISRRAVQKYRQIMGIPNSSQRKVFTE